MSREFHLPDLGEGIAEAQIIQVLVREGDIVAEDQGLFEVETDKAAVTIPSPFAGRVAKLHVKAGQTSKVGDKMIEFDGAGGASAPAPAVEKKHAASAGGSPKSATSITGTATLEVPASPARRTTAAAAPAIRKLAREMGVDIDSLVGTGPGGRVTKEDVESAGRGGGKPSAAPASPARTQPSAPAAPPPGVRDADKWGPVRKAPMSQIRKTIAQQMMRSVANIPHVTHIDTVDVTDLEALRRQYKEANDGAKRITAMAVIIKAVATSLKNHAVFNGSIDLEAGEIIYKDYINIGIAVDTERGLVVPNVRNADQLSISQIGEKLADIAESARASQFAIEDLRGGTFTITNVGALGGTFSTPIINYPEVAILGLGQSRETPVVRDGQIVIRTIMPISLSFDHRIADGAQAARFCKELFGYLEKPVTLLV